MNEPLVTIGIPTYNRASNHLEVALRGALAQTYPNIEVLVSDNCSGDGTPDLVRSFDDPRLRYVRHPANIGACDNANFIINEARGEYLVMHHDDDRIDPDFVETCIAAARGRRDVGLIVTGARVMDESGTVLRSRENQAGGLSAEDFILFWYRQRVNLFLCCCMFATRTLREIGGFDPEFGQFIDVAAEFRCVVAGARIDVREPKADFRLHADSLTKKARLSEWCRSSLALLDLACLLVGDRAAELREIGLRTSADRNYRYAVEAGSRWRRVGLLWTVFRHFDCRQFPRRQHLRRLLA